ncbi:UDP-Glycosyltransferase/glycogen phosphorylase [Thozetella sp. PMI_491]|nr:UDP-Glycosyltransferase/glycogen phosphorylase [Thozetella sp. PMI_491]
MANVGTVHQRSTHQTIFNATHVLAEWDRHEVVIGGFTTLELGSSYMPPNSLAAFLNTEEPIIAISFGSMNIPNPVSLIQAVASAAERVRAKIVFSRSWSAKLELGPSGPLPSHVYVIDTVPHDWLLPRVNGFVHHGGTGHMAAGLRAGVPMLVMPFYLDQHLWAAKLSQLELGPPPLELMRANNQGKPIDVNKLAESLEILLSGRYRGRCREMATRVRAEGDGATVAVNLIESQLEKSQNGIGSCVVIPELQAQWEHTESGLSLSGAAAASLVASGVLGWDDFKSQPRMDWTARWRNQTPKSRLHMLCHLANWLVYVVRFIFTVLGLVLGTPRCKAKAELADPIQQARIRKSVLDLQIVRQGFDDRGTVILGEELAKRWRAITADEFSRRLTFSPSDFLPRDTTFQSIDQTMFR